MRSGSQQKTTSEVLGGGEGRVLSFSQNLGQLAAEVAQAGTSLSADCQHP